MKTFSMDENGDMEIFHMYVVVGCQLKWLNLVAS
jgi:hypothetical protein